jgi:hypothetical protein
MNATAGGEEKWHTNCVLPDPICMKLSLGTDAEISQKTSCGPDIAVVNKQMYCIFARRYIFPRRYP